MMTLCLLAGTTTPVQAVNEDIVRQYYDEKHDDEDDAEDGDEPDGNDLLAGQFAPNLLASAAAAARLNHDFCNHALALAPEACASAK